MTLLPDLVEIRSLEQALHRPEIRRSRIELEGLLAEGFLEIGASGRAYDREAIITLLLEEEDDSSGELQTTNYALRPISKNAVLLTYEATRVYRDGSTRSTLRSSIWTHDGTKWQMLFHQGTVRAQAC
ncbi:RNase H [Rhizobium sp. Root274]|uniref:nuclear transport factor 2 family protein n=1 Tax=unclassified Rhizobium TaxID=2613769 RepID=UPI000714CB66|nr:MULTISPECIES: DUF4440 domain-containing protein [unclassified Rhizobium]KQW26954.1 RNase H [Rhizobium sp. Root1240]KRD27984.1 RNase H [Rhizobium sp. Root274]